MLLTYEDLAAFSVRIEAPEHITYKGYAVYTCGPWCQGPTLNMALKILEGVELKQMGHHSADYLHRLSRDSSWCLRIGRPTSATPNLCRYRWRVCFTKDMLPKDELKSTLRIGGGGPRDAPDALDDAVLGEPSRPVPEAGDVVLALVVPETQIEA